MAQWVHRMPHRHKLEFRMQHLPKKGGHAQKHDIHPSLSAKKVETGGSMGLAGQPVCPNW